MLSFLNPLTLILTHKCANCWIFSDNESYWLCVWILWLHFAHANTGKLFLCVCMHFWNDHKSDISEVKKKRAVDQYTIIFSQLKLCSIHQNPCKLNKTLQSVDLLWNEPLSLLIIQFNQPNVLKNSVHFFKFHTIMYKTCIMYHIVSLSSRIFFQCFVHFCNWSGASLCECN